MQCGWLSSRRLGMYRCERVHHGQAWVLPMAALASGRALAGCPLLLPCALLLSLQSRFLAVCALSVSHSCVPHKESTISHCHQMRAELSHFQPSCTMLPPRAHPPGPSVGHCPCSWSFCAGFQPCRDIWLLEFSHLQECV